MTVAEVAGATALELRFSFVRETSWKKGTPPWKVKWTQVVVVKTG
jgi:hypothetical protein